MSADLLIGPTWLVGCGNMAGAMVEGWRSAGVERPLAKPVGPAVQIVHRRLRN